MSNNRALFLKFWKLNVIVFMGVYLFSISCKTKKTTKQKNVPEKWIGNWVIKPVFDSLHYFDSAAANNLMTLNIAQYGVTEFVFSKSFADSVFMVNEDLNEYFSKINSIKNDTIVTADNSILIFDNTNNFINLTNAKCTKKNQYFKVQNNMLSNSKNINSKQVQKAFRKLFNAEFNKYSCILKDSANAIGERKYVSFFADGKIKGYKNYTHYYLHLNNNLYKVDNSFALELLYDKNSTLLGLKNYADSMEFFTTQLTSKPFEKPHYACHKKIATLLKHKWY